MLNRLPKFTKNFFFIVGTCFLVWMLFIDVNDFFTQYKLSQKLKTLEKEKVYYQSKIEDVRKEREQLLSDKELLEKFAREEYLMKKPTEDVYVIVKED
ncbi:MAG: septum formation initiator family protein [Bacteroidota bacterium]